MMKNEGSQGELRWYRIWVFVHVSQKHQDPVAKKSSKNDSKIKLKLILEIIENEVRRGLECPGETSGSHVGPQGRPGAPTCLKTTFEVPLGTPLGVTIFRLFYDFLMFFACLFRRLFWMAPGVDLDVVLG